MLVVRRSRNEVEWILEIRRAYIQIATICPQALRRELLAYQGVIVLLGIHSRLIGPGAGSAEVKFLAKPPEISEVSSPGLLNYSIARSRSAHNFFSDITFPVFHHLEPIKFSNHGGPTSGPRRGMCHGDGDG
jgi:hypothetical protein